MNKNQRNTLGLLSFLAILLYTIGTFVGKLIPSLVVFTHIGSILLLLIALYLGKDFADRQSEFLKIIYYVVAIIAIAAFIFGFF